MDRTYSVNANYGAGQVAPVINGIPNQGRLGPNYVKRLDCRLHLVLVQAAVAVAVPGRRMMEAIQRFNLNPVSGLPVVNNMKGFSLRAMQWPLTGKAPLDPADIAANPGGGGLTTTVDIPFTIYIEDDRALDSKDGGLPSSFLGRGAVNISWAATGYFGTGVTIDDDATTLYIDFIYGERFDVSVGERVTYEEIGVTTWQNQPLAPGQLTDLMILPNDGADGKAFDETSFASLSANEDGDPIHNNTVPDDIIDSFNHVMIQDTLGAVPTLDAAQTEFIPIIWAGKVNADMGDRAYAASAFSVLGTIGAGAPLTNDYVFVARRILPADASDAANQINAAAPDVSVGAAQLGLQVAAQASPDAAHNLVKVATDSQVPISHAGMKGAIFARFMRRKVNPTNLKAAAMAAASGATPAK